jgi:hypothetical protein
MAFQQRHAGYSRCTSARVGSSPKVFTGYSSTARSARAKMAAAVVISSQPAIRSAENQNASAYAYTFSARTLARGLRTSR